MKLRTYDRIYRWRRFKHHLLLKWRWIVPCHFYLGDTVQWSDTSWDRDFITEGVVIDRTANGRLRVSAHRDTATFGIDWRYVSGFIPSQVKDSDVIKVIR